MCQVDADTALAGVGVKGPTDLGLLPGLSTQDPTLKLTSQQPNQSLRMAGQEVWAWGIKLCVVKGAPQM